MEKQLGWAHNLGGVEPLWISKVGHAVLARLMESQIWYQSTGSVGGGLIKGTVASAWPDIRYQTLHSLPVYHWCLSSCRPSARVQRE